jgi:hypothetical protein
MLRFICHRLSSRIGWVTQSTTTREAGGLDFGQKAEALLCFDVEFAVAPGLGKNQQIARKVRKENCQVYSSL